MKFGDVGVEKNAATDEVDESPTATFLVYPVHSCILGKGAAGDEGVETDAAMDEVDEESRSWRREGS